MWKICLTIAGVVLVVGGAAVAGDNGRIYGKLTTVDGDVFEGVIRWDKNEAHWVDVLDGTKAMKKEREREKSRRRKYREREGTIEIFGFKLGNSSTTTWWSGNSTSGVRFGHLRSLEVVGDNEALLTLKSGEEVEFEGGSTDIGTDIREIVIDDEIEGEIELVWDDIERVDFMETKSGAADSFGDRLYGKLTTRRGDEFTGYVCWDVDEVYSTDILDGDDKRRSRKIKFGKISSIERYSSNGATITLVNGDEMVLRGSNDVDDSNRGIIIGDKALGQVRVDWGDFDRLDFMPLPDRAVEYKDFDGGRRLEGTVYTEDGESYTGTIRWDDDEEYTWEILDGDTRDVEFDIEFGLIKQIRKRSYRSSIVTVSDGREFRLRNSNDVDEDNKGIFITLSDGDEVEVYWEDFDRVEFSH
jgi:hypothetical protein